MFCTRNQKNSVVFLLHFNTIYNRFLSGRNSSVCRKLEKHEFILTLQSMDNYCQLSNVSHLSLAPVYSFTFSMYVCVFVVLGAERKASYILSTCSTTQLYTHKMRYSYIFYTSLGTYQIFNSWPAFSLYLLLYLH